MNFRIGSSLRPAVYIANAEVKKSSLPFIVSTFITLSIGLIITRVNRRTLMAGIAGIIYPDAFQVTQLIQPMLKTLRHRGQHLQSHNTCKNIELGSCGTPIAYNRRHSLWLVLDGTITNKANLIDDLKRDSRPVSADDDITTLIIHAFEAWDCDFINKIEGDFAIAIFDDNREQLFLFRDRIGKKPLYWYHDHRHFVFSSDLKALLTTGLIPQTTAFDALATYLFFGYFPQDVTPIEKVNKLLPAHYLRVHLDHNKAIQQYWSYSDLFCKEPCCAPDEETEYLDALLQQAVKKMLPSEEESGCFVSGGLGSASIAHYLCDASKDHPPSTFTIGFKGETDRDIASAAMTANALQLKHYVGTIGPDDCLDDLGDIIWHLGEPLADPNIVATWRLAKLAATHTKTVFSGMGSDELLAAHIRYVLPKQKLGISYHFYNAIKPFLKRFLLPLISRIHRPTAFRFLKHYPASLWQVEYLTENAMFNTPMLANAAPELVNLFDPETFLNKFYHITRFSSEIDATLYLDVKTRLADLYILQYERLTTAHSLQWLTPFLDEDIVAFLASQPKDVSLKKPSMTVLKPVLQNVLPSAVIERTKTLRQGFLRTWTYEKELRKAFSLLPSGTLVGNGIISKRWLNTLLEERRRRSNPFPLLWSILCLEIWYKLFIDNPARTKPPNASIFDILTQ